MNLKSLKPSTGTRSMSINQLQTKLFYYWYNYKLGLQCRSDLQNLSQTVEEFVTEQTLDTDAELVSSQTNQFQPAESSIWKQF